MKNTCLLLAFSFFLFSCSSDDTNNSNNNSTTDFLPMAQGNYWVYDTESSTQSGTDSLYVANDTVIAGNTYAKFKADPAMPYGFYSNSISNNGVRKSGDRLLITGAAAVNFSPEFPLSVNVTDLVIFKESTTDGQQLGTVSGTVHQQVEGFVVDFDYTLTTTAKADLATYSVDGMQYTNVKQVETRVNLKVSTQIDLGGTSLPATIMPAQDVLVSRQYYAENIGVVYVVTDINYSLSDLSLFNIQLPIPQSGADHQEEVLVNYHIN